MFVFLRGKERPHRSSAVSSSRTAPASLRALALFFFFFFSFALSLTLSNPSSLSKKKTAPGQMVKDERDIALTRNQKLERVRRGNNQTSAVAFELTSSLPLSLKKKKLKNLPLPFPSQGRQRQGRVPQEGRRRRRRRRLRQALL